MEYVIKKSYDEEEIKKHDKKIKKNKKKISCFFIFNLLTN